MLPVLRAMDIAVAVWSIQLGLWVVGGVVGGVSTAQPGAIVGQSDLGKLFIVQHMDSISDILTEIIQFLVLNSVIGIAASRIFGFTIGQTLLTIIGIGAGLFLLGKMVGWMLAAGSMVKVVLESAIPGLVVPNSIVWGINAVTWLLGVIALVEWWRGLNVEYLG